MATARKRVRSGCWAGGELLAAVLLSALLVPAAPARAAPPNPPPVAIDRTVLPIPEPAYPPITELDARKVTPPPVFEEG